MYTAVSRSPTSSPTEWQPPRARTVVVVPHPDDEVLAAGGLILHQRSRGLPVIAVAVTDGGAAYPDWDAAQLRAVRVLEQRGALSELGVAEGDVVRFGLPDAALAGHEAELLTRLREVVHEEDLLVAPWVRDFHADHEACGRVARTVAAGVGCRLVATLVWAWRYADLHDHDDIELLRLSLPPPLERRRWSAMRCHHSQLDPPNGEPMVDDELLAPLHQPFETYVRYRR